MLRYLHANDLHAHPRLARGMFRDRAAQFATRLGWEVTVDAAGEERDDYDALNPLYVIWEGPDGRHKGSLRLLPTTGRTMVNEHFRHLTGGTIASPLIWECTRFCLSPGAGRSVAGALMLGGGEVMRHFGLRRYVGVFDARMARIYRLIGASPEVIGGAGRGRERINVGLWAHTPGAHHLVAQRAGLSTAISAHWFRRAFGGAEAAPLNAAG